jgi:hypothetical protein
LDLRPQVIIPASQIGRIDVDDRSVALILKATRRSKHSRRSPRYGRLRRCSRFVGEAAYGLLHLAVYRSLPLHHHPARRRLADTGRHDKEASMLGALGLLAAGGGSTDTILWIIAAILVVAGVVALIRGSVIVGVVLIVLGLLVGPGGVSIFN